MLFNSLVFLVFVFIFFILWPCFREKTGLRLTFLAVASCIFYGWWNWSFLWLLLFSAAVDFYSALLLDRYPKHRKSFLFFSLSVNLLVLGSFKYLGFFTESVNGILGGESWQIPIFHLVLPVGISFYTFQSMSYTIDVYRRELRPTTSFLHFFVSLSLFPQMVAGPIIRASTLLPQILNLKKVNFDDFWFGFRLIVFGYFKKTVIADNIAPVVNEAFRMSPIYEGSLYWLVIMSLFAIQIYCDFSGYSDIAIGFARWIGVSLPENFHLPYLATSLKDFWNRWHISLSTWFRDYVYLPLGGNRFGSWISLRNLWVSFLLSGLWHGANWTFVCWGALHAAFLSFERWTEWPAKIKKIYFGNVIAIALVFFQVTIAWIFFRAESVSQAFHILSIIFSFHRFELSILTESPSWVFILTGLIILALKQLRVSERVKWLEPVTLAFLASCAIFLRGPGSQFIYFQF